MEGKVLSGDLRVHNEEASNRTTSRTWTGEPTEMVTMRTSLSERKTIDQGLGREDYASVYKMRSALNDFHLCIADIMPTTMPMPMPMPLHIEKLIFDDG